jgi:predicted AlkP superfamily pyrophosphatase or phosphodiesterase
MKYAARFNRFITGLLLIILFSALLIIAGFTESQRKSYKNYVILVSLDGFRWDYADLYRTPNINRIASQGVKADRMIPSFPTVTFPNHYTIATGLYPDHHGLVDNSFKDSELGLSFRMGDRAAVENPVFYGGEPIWVTAQRQGVNAASFFWVGSEAPVKGMHPTYWKNYDSKISFEARIDTVIKWLGYPLSRRPGLVTLYFDEPDITSHKFGPVSPQTGRVIERLDSLIGVLRLKLSLLPCGKKINLILLSDHGMGAVSPQRYINLRDLVPPGMITSVIGGNPVIMINPAAGKKDSILFLLKPVKGIKAWSKTEVPERLHFGTNPRIPEIIVVADSSWSIGIRPDASSIKGGAHGYDNSDSDMFAIFYAAGPAFKQNYRFHELNNTDIYDLICRILDLKPAANDGIMSHIEGLLR